MTNTNMSTSNSEMLALAKHKWKKKYYALNTIFKI